MIYNYFKNAYRNIFSSKLFSFINIIGLSVGLASFFLIFHFVQYEKSFDQTVKDSDRVFRLRIERTPEGGQPVQFASCAPPAGTFIKESFPEVEILGRIIDINATISYKNNVYYEDKMFFADTDFFKIFSPEFITDFTPEIISKPNTAIISESISKKYFGDINSIGKILEVDKKLKFEVVGVFKDLPQNNHLKYKIVLSFENVKDVYGADYLQAWGHTGTYTYLKMKPNFDLASFNKKIDDLIEREFGEALKHYKMSMSLPLQPVKSIHLNSSFMQEYEANGDEKTINILQIIAFLIIFIAWANFVNLNSAKSLSRAKEVGLRKVVGASKAKLAIQFYLEYLVLNVFSFFITFLIIQLSLPWFNSLTGVDPSFSIWNQEWFYIGCGILFFANVFVAGLYPVILLSSYSPVKIVSGNFKTSKSGVLFRKVLVSTQFVMALLLITSTFAIYQQIIYLQNKSLGFDIEQTVVLKAPRVRDSNYAGKVKSFKDELKKHNDILSVAHTTEVPGKQLYWDAGAIFRQGEDASKTKTYFILGIDEDFMDLFNFTITQGRNFSSEFTSEEKNLLLNEKAVNWMGFSDTDEVIGQKVNYWGEIYTIIGIVKNYHQQSPKVEYEPQLFRYLPTGRGVRGNIAVKLKTTDMQTTMNKVSESYAEFFPGNPVNFFFMDEYFDQQYKSDRNFANIVGLFSIIALIVTMLGIFGLTLYNVNLKTKEIGIRKVLGADLTSLFFTLSKDVLKLIVLAFIISIPLVYYSLNEFLSNYAHKTPLGIVIFVMPLILIFVVTLLVISFQIIKASIINPCESMRYE